MKLKSFLSIATIAIAATMTITSCQKGDLLSNPNAASASAPIPLSLLVNNVTANLIFAEELPFGNGNVYKYDQYQVSAYSKYWGNNEYGWNYTTDSYQILKYAIALETQAQSQLGSTNNKYFAVSKFLRAYAAVWLSQRVGDIPMTQAGNAGNITPVYDAQKLVYQNTLALLDTANSIMTTVNTVAANQSAVLDGGDIFGLTNLQWQKLINTYKLRVLISLSKRADDNADLNIKTQFNAIVTNPAKYPIMTSNSDNMVYKFTASNLYPPFALGNNSYNNFMNVGKPLLDITTVTNDPRTYLYACPASSQIPPTGAKAISDFTAYIGADSKLSLTALQTASTSGAISNFNGIRYFTTGFVSSNTLSTYEPFIFIGYPEMCFNIAEGINRGWAPSLTATDAKSWYDNGISGSFKNLGLSTTASSTVTISDVAGKSLGTVTTNNAPFLTSVAYNTGNSAAALTQILQQKYVAMFMNSGYEAFFNARRTGVPALNSGGAGTGTPTGAIPKRWLYPLSEINYNTANYTAAISSQFGGSEDVTKDTWITK